MKICGWRSQTMRSRRRAAWSRKPAAGWSKADGNLPVMPLDEKNLERTLRERLEVALKVRVAREPASAVLLSAIESAHLSMFDSSARRADWLTGRAALKALLVELGEDADTSKIDFPRPPLLVT